MKCTRTPGLDAYCLEIVGGDARSAKQIAAKLTAGIAKSADYCGLEQSACVGNLDLPRSKMPQIETSPYLILRETAPKKAAAMLAAGGSKSAGLGTQDRMLRWLSNKGVWLQKEKMPVGMLRATQREILAPKAASMADAHLRGKFPSIGQQIVISADNYVLDGHHRWAALSMIAPEREMDVLQVGMPMRALLDVSRAFPGVYRADFQGQPLTRQTKHTIADANKAFAKYKKTTLPLLDATYFFDDNAVLTGWQYLAIHEDDGKIDTYALIQHLKKAQAAEKKGTAYRFKNNASMNLRTLEFLPKAYAGKWYLVLFRNQAIMVFGPSLMDMQNIEASRYEIRRLAFQLTQDPDLEPLSSARHLRFVPLGTVWRRQKTDVGIGNFRKPRKKRKSVKQ